MTMFDNRPLTELSASELYALGDELAAYIKHPAIKAKPHLRSQAGDRLGQVMGESERRWRAVWEHPSNMALLDTLDTIT